MNPVLLAFDTSTDILVAGLSSRGGTRTVCAPGGAAASTHLLPQLKALLAQAGHQWSDLQAIAFGQGPGAFTGLRTSCAVAQGLGLGLNLPLLAIDSLQVVAEDARHQWAAARRRAPQLLDIGVVMDARMDEIYAARYRWQSGVGDVAGSAGSAGGAGGTGGTGGTGGAGGIGGVGDTAVAEIAEAGTWQVFGPAALYTLPALQAAWHKVPPHALAGSAIAAFGARLGLPQVELRFEHEADRAAALLQLALRAFAQGLGVNAAQALPLYLRDKVAQTTQERAVAQALKRAALPPMPRVPL